MTSSKALELQLQVKQNAEELQDFVRDLENWEKDIRQKDLELQRQSGVPEEVSDARDGVRTSELGESPSELVFVIIVLTVL